VARVVAKRVRIQSHEGRWWRMVEGT